MKDNFNLNGFLKNNNLLKENIGGFVDMKPLGEFEGKYQDFSTTNQPDDMDSADYGEEQGAFDRMHAFAGLELEKLGLSMINDEGYEAEDVAQFFRDFADHFLDQYGHN